MSVWVGVRARRVRGQRCWETDLYLEARGHALGSRWLVAVSIAIIRATSGSGRTLRNARHGYERSDSLASSRLRVEPKTNDDLEDTLKNAQNNE